MTTAPVAPAANLVKTSHNLTIDGYSFQIQGWHEFRFAKISKMSFAIHLLQGGTNRIGMVFHNKVPNIRKVASELIAKDTEAKKRAVYYKRFEGMSLTEVLSHPDFRYGRVVTSTLGNYVNIYSEDIYSPTGVSLVDGCSQTEFDAAAKSTGNSHNYVVGSEGRRVVNS